MDHPHLSAAKGACSDTGGKWMDHPPFSHKERLFGHGGKWMDHPPFHPQKSAYADTGRRWMRRMGAGASSPSSGAKESVKEASPSSIAQGRALSAPSSSSSVSA